MELYSVKMMMEDDWNSFLVLFLFDLNAVLYCRTVLYLFFTAL